MTPKADRIVRGSGSRNYEPVRSDAVAARAGSGPTISRPHGSEMWRSGPSVRRRRETRTHRPGPSSGGRAALTGGAGSVDDEAVVAEDEEERVGRERLGVPRDGIGGRVDDLRKRAQRAAPRSLETRLDDVELVELSRADAQAPHVLRRAPAGRLRVRRPSLRATAAPRRRGRSSRAGASSSSAGRSTARARRSSRLARRGAHHQARSWTRREMSQRIPSTRSIRVERAPWRRAMRAAQGCTSNTMRGRFVVAENVENVST